MICVSRGLLAAAWLCVSATLCAQTPTKPVINGPLTEGQSTITGTAQPVTSTITAVVVQLCITTDKPAATVPTTCTPAFATLNPVAATGKAVDTNGAAATFSAILATPLTKGQYVVAVQTSTAAAAPTLTASDPVQVSGITPPMITSPLTPPVVTISGTAQPTTGLYTEVKVFICVNADKTKVGTDCSTDATLHAKVDVPGSPVTQADSTDSNANGTFTANLHTAITANQNVWLWEVATVAGVPNGVTGSSTAGLAASAPVRPVINQPLKDGDKAVQGTATKSASIIDPVTVQLCVKEAVNGNCVLTGYTSSVGTDGTFSIPHTLREGEILEVEQSSGNSATPIDPAMKDSVDVTVSVPDNERIYTDFIAGVLLSQTQQSFSQANLFLGINVDDAFYRPGWYSQFRSGCKRKIETTSGGAANQQGQKPKAEYENVACTATRHPGLNGFFSVRLTSIPVTSTETTTTTATATATPVSTYDTFLVSRKTAHFEIGTYMPFYFGHTHLPTSALRQAFFIAPIARFGFNTLTSDDSGTNTSAPTAGAGGTVVTSTTAVGDGTSGSSKVYSFGVVGTRIGTADMKAGSAHIVQYLDIGAGKFSNLTNLYCSMKRTDNCLSGGSAGPPVVAGTFDPTKESHYTPFRVLVEGAIDIDGFVIGFSINKGVNWLGSHRPSDYSASNPVITQAQDDVRFLLGYKFDVNKLLTSVKKVSNF